MATPGTAATLAVKDGLGNAQTLEAIIAPDSVSLEMVHAEDAAQRAALIAALAPPRTPVSTPAAAATLIVSAAPCRLFGVDAIAGASPGFVMLFDAATAPADGAVTPLKCWPLAANAALHLEFPAGGLALAHGCVLVFSTTGPFTKTASATAFLSGDAA